MKRAQGIVMVVIGIAATALVFAAASAQAAPAANQKSLKGDYRFVVSDIRLDDPPAITYCSEYGTMTFDGAGNATSLSTRRCIVAGGTAVNTPDVTGTFTYTVDPDGTVLVTEVKDPAPPVPSITHCQLTESGDMLLCDAIGRDNSILLFQAIAVRK